MTLDPHLPPSPYQGKIRSRDHFTISALWFGMNFLWGGMLLILLPNESRKLAPGDPAQFGGMLQGVGAVAALVIPLFVGALSDRCTSRWGRRRPYIAAGIAIALLGLLGMVLSAADYNISLFFLSYIVLQLGANIANGAYTGVIPDLVPQDQRGISSGFMATFSGLGTAAGVLSVTKLIGVSPSAPYLAIALVLGGVCAWTLFGVREGRLASCGPPLRWRTYLASLWISPNQYPDFAWVWITRALVMLGAYAVLPFLYYYLQDVIGVAEPGAALNRLMGLMLVGNIVTGLGGGWLSDRIGRKRVVYVANGSMAVFAICFPFARSMADVNVLGILFGLSFGAYTSVDWALGTDVLPSREHAGKDMAVWHVAQALPQAIGAAAGGVIVGAFGVTESISIKGAKVVQYNDAGYIALFATSALCLMLGAVLLTRVRGAR